jgi:putative peptidoglycan lipid II flippase
MTSASAGGGRIARSTGILAVSTSLSRVLGFVRDVLIARLFGTTLQAQAFVVAFRLPNLLRDLVAEGAVTSAFVPVLSWYRAKGKSEEFWQLTQALGTRLLLLLCLLGLLGWWGAEGIVRLVAPGFAADHEKLALTVRLTRLLFPFITLVGLWAYFMGVLNSLRHFTMPALGPAILNIAMIVACVWFVPRTSPGIVAVAIAVIVGGVIQLAIQVPVAVRLGFRWRWRWTHPGAQEIMRLLGPRMVGAAVYQASVLIDTALASVGSIVGEGAVAALYFANRLVQLPLAVFGTASAQASLPALSEHAAHHDWAKFRATLLSVIRMVGFVILPSAVGLIVLAQPIVVGLFERGAFDHRSSLMTSRALVCYALGLFAYALSKVLTGAFYALRQTRVPVKLAAEAVAINIALSLALMGPLQVSGLALAAALSNSLNAYRLIRHLERQLKVSLLAPVSGALGRMLLASCLMGLGVWLVWQATAALVPGWVGIMMAMMLGVVCYGLVCHLIRVEELSIALRWCPKLPFIQRFVSE